MRKIAIIGHFGFGLDCLDGQTVKTKILAEELENQVGEEQVLKIDTHGGIKSLFKAPFQVLKALKNAKNIIILPAHNGLKVYAPLLNFFRKFYKQRKLHYVVIGGWLASFLKNKKGLTKTLKKFDGIYVETASMNRDLDELGFQNVSVMPNCKKLNVLEKEQLVYADEQPYKLCTFSRVMKEKGIEDAINSVKVINEKYSKTVFALDIYGPIDKDQIEWFDNLQKEFPEYVRYGGLVPFDKSVEVLKDYFALLFPTRFFTEGIPGTIIDAYAAGIPVISAKWQSFADILEDGVTGMGYEFGNENALTDILLYTLQNPDKVNALKENCIKEAQKYMPKYVVGKFIEKANI